MHNCSIFGFNIRSSTLYSQMIFMSTHIFSIAKLTYLQWIWDHWVIATIVRNNLTLLGRILKKLIKKLMSDLRLFIGIMFIKFSFIILFVKLASKYLRYLSPRKRISSGLFGLTTNLLILLFISTCPRTNSFLKFQIKNSYSP